MNTLLLPSNKFFILNDRYKIMVFCSPVGLEILSKRNRWAGDGTFHVAAKYYYQLYIIQAYFKERMIPCVFALMHEEEQKII